MSDIKMHDSLTSDDSNIDGLNLENLNSLNNLVNMNIDSDLSDDVLPSLKNTLQQMYTQEQPQQQPQQRPPQQQQQQRPPQPQQQRPPQQQKTEPNLIQQKQVSFNEQIEQKTITSTPEENTNVQPQILEEIKKIKIGKLLIPQTTLFFTIILAVIGSVLFYTTRPKPKKIDK